MSESLEVVHTPKGVDLVRSEKEAIALKNQNHFGLNQSRNPVQLRTGTPNAENIFAASSAVRFGAGSPDCNDVRRV